MRRSALLLLLALAVLSPGLARSSAPPTLLAQLRRAAEDPYLTAGQRDFYAGRLFALETGSAADSVVPPGGDAAWSVYAQSPRRGSAMVVHDFLNDRLIMFGGNSAQGLESDVWAVSLSGDRVWRRIPAVGPGPTGRLGAAVTFDSDQKRLLVYGGADADGSYLDDLWALSLDGPPVWSALLPAGPAPGARANASGVRDGLHHRMVVIGGSDGSFSPPTSVWTLPFVANPTWTQLPTTGAPPPTPAVAFYDSLVNSALVFGQTSTYPYSVTFYQLGLDSFAWTSLTVGCCGPSGSPLAPVAFDPYTRNLVTWSYGVPGSCYRIRLNQSSPTWEYLYNNPVGPYSHNGTALLYDARRARTMMVGGTTGSGIYEADVWSCGSDPMVWTSEVIPLSRRNGASIALDEARHQAYLFGGNCDTTANNQIDRLSNGLWRMTLGNDAAWQRLPSRGGPLLGRSQASLVHDRLRDRLVLFGGQRVGTMTNEVWTYSLIDTLGWTRLTITGLLPRQRASHGAVYDSIGDRMVVFGGIDAGNSLSDLWALDFAPTAHWERLLPSGVAPDPRAGMGMVFDPDSLRILIAGGAPNYYAYYGYSDELWSLDLSPTLRWRKLIPGPPYSSGPYRAMGLLVYDRAHHDVLLVQGHEVYASPAETWVRIARPGVDSLWTPLVTSGPPPTRVLPSVGNTRSRLREPARSRRGRGRPVLERG